MPAAERQATTCTPATQTPLRKLPTSTGVHISIKKIASARLINFLSAVLQPPTCHLPPTCHQPATNLPPTCHQPATYLPPTWHLPSTYLPPTWHLPGICSCRQISTAACMCLIRIAAQVRAAAHHAAAHQLCNGCVPMDTS